MEPRIFGEAVLFRLGALPVTVTMLTSLAVSAVLAAAALGLSWSV